MELGGTTKRRRRLARSLEQAALPERPFFGRGPRYLVHPNMAAACAPSLLALARAFRDETQPIDEESIAAVRTFLHGQGSPFLGGDATEALRQIVRLQHHVVGAETAALDAEPSPSVRTATAVEAVR